ncbi:MAG: bifunctional (p)ppGpp synthetase/guanosine-3',5'-bis(diphosphate) 3'-pyrophosphohydrolase [Giesbergeria sp.]|nr:bifunctional (p)ppGpp synthetase/guanosine-3',5'-bis(diphosphate) 3'-pyrophosphohydrolase [Giesbergeria sp.]MBP6322103.1 bifunctional (p)ppGpp synthetase/guanosine-3',5'-bis(diphosphate) 3'-pyrophosphohydrolase [Giesbergeria sp.]MBP8029183.1 bifunctional (p)ppGpp synthetase/guanosine-3',5'-bis(diphosphate) 3'-pyrophosphohydrolase [Giesbergeria sp.]
MKVTPTAATGAAAAQHSLDAIPSLLTATAHALPEQMNTVARARAFAQPLISEEVLQTGENALAHTDAVSAMLKSIGSSEAMQAAIYLVHACIHLNKPAEVIGKAFGPEFAALAVETTKLMRVQQHAQALQASAQQVDDSAVQTENVRKMLLAFSRDLRVVMLRLASRLQTLRYYAASKRPVSPSMAREALQVFAPLASRLGIWQFKWELEDLAFRFLEPETYRDVARLLDEKRVEREAYMAQLSSRVESELRARSISASVQGRPKHIYSIVKKMRGKSLQFHQVFDIHALRVVVPNVKDCYAALSWVHAQYLPIVEEFDDYIAKPKANGYQSLHTVVRDETGKAIEIQIRTQAMHDHAENGVAAHWAYKEAGTKGYVGVSATGDYDAKIAVLRQLLAWERDMSGAAPQQSGLFDDRIYVLTPDAAIVELPQGATPVDFAYLVHTSLGHRCRGARVDGAMVPLNTPLKNGQTVEITAAKEGGPSRDWLNPELGYLNSHRARAKARAWFNALAQHETIARGRESVEKLLQREGKTAMRLEDLAAQLGFKSADALFEAVGKDDFSLRNIEILLRPPEPVLQADDYLLLKKARNTEKTPKGGVLVVGIDSLMTQLAKCCKPAPPDAIGGFVTRGKGVSVHRTDCSNFRELAARTPERLIDVEWGTPKSIEGAAVYPVDVAVEASDRQGLLRDISEVFAKEKMNVIGVQTQSIKGTAWMTFTVEVLSSAKLNKVLGVVALVKGVRWARRR